MPFYRHLDCKKPYEKSRCVEAEADKQDQDAAKGKARIRAMQKAKAEAFGSLGVILCPSPCQDMKIEVWFDPPTDKFCYQKDATGEHTGPGAAIDLMLPWTCVASCCYHIKVRCRNVSDRPTGLPIGTATGHALDAPHDVGCRGNVTQGNSVSASAKSPTQSIAEEAAGNAATAEAHQQALKALYNAQCVDPCPRLESILNFTVPTVTSTAAGGLYEATAKCSWFLWVTCLPS